MSRYSLRNRSSCVNEHREWEENKITNSNLSNSLMAGKRAAYNMESNLSPSILTKFQRMTTFSPHNPRSAKKAAHSLLNTSVKNDDVDKNVFIQDTDSLIKSCDPNSTNVLEHLAMTDADILPVELPERYNYQVWEDPGLAKDTVVEEIKKPSEFEVNEKENLWRPSAILHAFSPFKRNREERALKALSIASFPEYLQLKGQFFNELGKSFFKRKEKDLSRFRATKINLFRNRYHTQQEYPRLDSTNSKPINLTTDVDPICKIPTPEIAKRALVSTTVIQYSPIEQSQRSAFRPVSKDGSTNMNVDKCKPKATENHDLNDTPFNTPRSEFIKRSVDHDLSSKNVQDTKEHKRNLRPRPTRPPTLFGFASDCSEDDTYASNKSRKRRK